MTMYFQKAAERRPERNVDSSELRRISMSERRLDQLWEDYKTEVRDAEKETARELGVKEVNYSLYSGENCDIFFDVRPESRKVGDIEMNVFNTQKLTELTKTLLPPNFKVSMPDLTTTEALNIEALVGQSEGYEPDVSLGTYRELEKKGFVRREGKDYVPTEDIRLLRTGKTKGLRMHDVYEAQRRVLTPIYTSIKVLAVGKVSVKTAYLENENVKQVLDSVVEKLFQAPMPPVALL